MTFEEMKAKLEAIRLAEANKSGANDNSKSDDNPNIIVEVSAETDSEITGVEELPLLGKIQAIELEFEHKISNIPINHDYWKLLNQLRAKS